MKIALDLDGVCYNFDLAARRWLQKHHAVFVPYPSPKWNYIKEQVSGEVWHDLWTNGPHTGLFNVTGDLIIPGAREGVAWLQERHDVSVLTSRPASAMPDILRVCCELGVQDSDVIRVDSGAAKADVPFDLYIEDSPEALEALRRTTADVVVFDQPWNRSVSSNAGTWYSVSSNAGTWYRAFGWRWGAVATAQVVERVVEDIDRLRDDVQQAVRIAEQVFEHPPTVETPPDDGEDPGVRTSRFHEHLARLGELHDRKAADYGKDEDPLANVRASEEWGMPSWVGAMVRLNDKVRRLQSLAKKGSLRNEPALDSFDDIAVYAIIARTLYEDENGITSS